jgi:hypothetical protein
LCIKDSNLHGIKVPSAPAPQETLTEEMWYCKIQCTEQ